MYMKKRFSVIAVLAGMALVLMGCPQSIDNPKPPDDPEKENPAYTSHLEMLKALGVTMTTKRVDPKGNELRVSYDPLGASGAATVSSGTRFARAVETGGGGKVTLAKQSEIFVAGIVNPSARWTGFIEDLGDSSGAFATLAQHSATEDPAWTNLPKATIAGDFDGDGLDEVLVAVGYTNPDRISLRKVQYKNNAYSDTEIRSFNYTGSTPFSTIFVNTDWTTAALSGVSGDFDGDGKDEVVLLVGNMVYLIDDSSTNFKEHAYFSAPNATATYPNGGVQLHAAVADYDQDGLDEYILTCCGPANGLTAAYYIYDDWTNGGGRTVLHQGNTQVPSTSSSAIQSASVAVGDFDGDGLPETVFCGVPAAGDAKSIYKILILDTEMDDNSKPVFSFLDLGNTDMSIGGGQAGWTPGIAAGDMDGDGRDEFFATREVFSLNAAKNALVWPTGTSLNCDVAYNLVQMGDVTGDKRADVVLVNNGDPMELTVIWLTMTAGVATGLTSKMTTHYGAYMESPVKHFPAFCLPNVDRDSFVLEFTGHELLYSDPIIEAVIASPPYWEGINEEGSGGTTYGKSSGVGGALGASGGFKVGYSVGAEFDSGVFGNFGFEYEQSVNYGFNWGVSASTNLTESWAYSTGVGEDKVVFTAIPYDVYYYRVVTAPANNGAGEDSESLDAGDTMVISVPRKPGTFNQALTYYNDHNGETWDVALNHTPGQPGTYHTSSDITAIKAAARSILGSAKGLYSTRHTTVGVSNTGSTSQGVEETTGMEVDLGFEVEVSTEAKVKAGGVTTGVNWSYSFGINASITSEDSIFIEGEVPDIPTARHTTDLDFDWGLLMYPTAGTGQNFNLVTYWVDR
jgi:hypothetical protein